MKKGILLVNLGSPDSYEVPDVKRYLGEFLMDERVIDVSKGLRYFLVNGIILNTRPKKSAAAYKSIWWEEGSPLIVLSKQLQQQVQSVTQLPVGLGMRYGNPGIKEGIQELVDQNPDLEEFLLIPLYPHYAMSSYETVVVKAREVVEQHFPNLSMKVKDAFFNDERYLNSLARTLKPALDKGYDHILFSYHGVPERHIRKGDITKSHCLQVENCCVKDSPAHKHCYRHQTLKTTALIAEKLNLPGGKYSSSFQSRLGSDPWLTPFTDKTIIEYAKKGIKRLVVLCPAFVSDCLETIEEIGEEGRELFLENGGEEFTLVPCLNDQKDWAKLLADWGGEALKNPDPKTGIKA